VRACRLWASRVEDGRFSEAIPLLQLTRRYREAIAALCKSVELLPDSTQARHELGLALFETGAWQESAPYFEFVAQKRPKFPDAEYSLTAVYARIPPVPEAIDLLQKLLQQNAQHFRARPGLNKLAANRITTG
jgi:tetratricopeptide (TPR) repeat protein